MDFLSFVKKGVDESKRSLAAIAEVNSIFENVNADLKRYEAGELKLDRRASTMAQITSFSEGVAGLVSGSLKADRIFLSLKTTNGTFSEDVAGWKQRTTGYPCVLKFDGQELSCDSAAHLVSGISEFLASVGFGNAVNRLVKQALDSEELKRKGSLEKRDMAVARRLASKPIAAKPAAKPAASLTKRPASKKPATKPTAPPSRKKPVAPSKSSDGNTKAITGKVIHHPKIVESGGSC